MIYYFKNGQCFDEAGRELNAQEVYVLYASIIATHWERACWPWEPETLRQAINRLCKILAYCGYPDARKHSFEFHLKDTIFRHYKFCEDIISDYEFSEMTLPHAE